MADPEKRKKISRRWLVGFGLSVTFTVYFFGLVFFGQWYRTTYPGPPEPPELTTLKKGWVFKPGDDASWSQPGLDDHDWMPVKLDSLPDNYQGELGWFRLRFKTDTFMQHHPTVFRMHMSGAAEVFLDGKQVARYGHPAATKEKEIDFDPHSTYIPADLAGADTHLLAVRFSNFNYISYQGMSTEKRKGFRFEAADRDDVIDEQESDRFSELINFSVGIFLLTLSLIHLLLFLFYRKAKENLLYSIFVFCYSMVFVMSNIAGVTNSPAVESICRDAFLLFLNPLMFISLICFTQYVFSQNFGRRTLIAFLMGFFGISQVFFSWPGLAFYFFSLVWYGIYATISLAQGTRKALKEKRPGAKILGTGAGSFALLLFVIISVMFFSGHLDISLGDANPWLAAVIILGLLSIPISMSVYIASTSARTSADLSLKLAEVEKLSALTLEQQKEKQRILETQKETLELQVKERTLEIEEQKKVIEEKNKDITDSINYAKHIQEAILTSRETKYRLFKDAFVLFKPKDIVSGDFYWFAEMNGCRLIASCDCTGHGVPGALMSMIGNNILNQTVLERGITSPDEVLNHLDHEVRTTLKQDKQSETKDGMDVALLSFRSDNEFDYAGAQRPLWIIRKGILEEIKADKFSIGGGHTDQEKKFTKHSFTLQKGDCVYIFSDGFADQFNRDDKKLMTKRFKDILCGIQDRSMPEQEKYLDDFIENWKGNLEQTDDILVIGIRI